MNKPTNDPIKKKYNCLSALKLIMAIVIVYFHVYPLIGTEDPNRFFDILRKWGGTIGNCSFFVVSGFLITGGYQEKIICSKLSLRSFVRRRLVKLYPLYFTTTIVGLLVNYELCGLDNITIKKVIYNFLMISTGWIENVTRYNSPTWFLSVLMLDYILFFCFCYFSKICKNRNLVFYMSCLMVIFGGIVWTYKIEKPFMFYLWNGLGYIGFFEGAILNHLVNDCWSNELRKKITYFVSVVIIGCLLIGYRVGMRRFAEDMTIFIYVLVVPILLLWGIELSRVLTSSKLADKVCDFMGEFSMHLFFWHSPVYTIAYYLLKPRGWIFNSSQVFILSISYYFMLFVVCVFSYCVDKYIIQPKLLDN